MPSQFATPFPVFDQNYRIPCIFRDTSNNLITGWTGAAATVYPGNLGGTPAVAIAEAPAASGVGYIDISAGQMSTSMVMVVATVSNSNAVAYTAAIYPLMLGQFTGRWDVQAILRFEQLVKDILYLSPEYGATQNGAQFQVLNEDQSVHTACVVGQNGPTGLRTLMQ